MRRYWLLIASALLLCACAIAQSAGPDSRPITLPAPPPGMAPAGGDVFYHTQKAGNKVSAGYFAFAEFGKPVTGAPYSATAVTETRQVLADGNRIVNKTTTVLARDSQGRTRREEALGNIGPLAVKAPTMVFISDPVSNNNYVLDLNDQTAQVLPPVKVAAVAKQMVTSSGQVAVGAARLGSGAGTGIGAGSGPLINVENVERKGTLLDGPEAAVEQRIVISTNDAGLVKTESLGTQVIEGVAAEGKRITRTIPAGQIGNERPLEITSEVWTSPDLQVIVMSKRNDPRFGETLYRLTNINHTEPDPSLFQIPTGFTVRNPGGQN